MPALFVCFIFIFQFSALGQERPTDYQIKAAFLEKFAKFVDWPDSAFANSEMLTNGMPVNQPSNSNAQTAPLCIGVFSSGSAVEAQFFQALETLAQNDAINGRRVQVMPIKAKPDLKCCQIIFIPASMKSQERDILDEVKGQATLTVGDTDDFCRVGGMIQFVIEDEQVHFEINNPAARAAGLKISSKLLTLAKRTQP